MNLSELESSLMGEKQESVRSNKDWKDRCMIEVTLNKYNKKY